jgi:CelD/BcsL family acetyltransferase involved in cellulose biosynthesis
MSFEGHRDTWTQLAVRARNLFATYEWAETWWRHFGDGQELRVTRVGDPPVALLPLYVQRQGLLRVLRFVGHGPADELGPVCGPEGREAAAQALAQALDGEGFHLFLGDHLGPGWSAALGLRVVDRISSPVAVFSDSSWDGFLASRSANFRGQVRSRERRLRREHDVTFRLTEARDRLEPDLDTLFRLHRLRWPEGRSFTPAEAFHRDFAAQAFELGWLRLWTLELDGRPAAAWLGYRFAGAELYYQAGRDPAFERDRVGFVLLAHTIREAVEGGAAEYRFLQGGEAFKYRFATGDPGVETVARARGLPGRLALAGRALRRRFF